MWKISLILEKIKVRLIESILKNIKVKKFIIIYHAPMEALAKMVGMTPEQQAEGMKPWFAWK